MYPHTAIEAMISDLVTEQVLRTVIDSITGLEPANIPAVISPDRLTSVHSVTKLYGNTAGPFGGIGGRAMTWFRLTVIYSDEVMLLFANERFYGFTGYRPEVLRDVDESTFLRVPVAVVRGEG